MIDATRWLLRESGFGGTTIDAIAARSGVAKTTIYRQWADRNDLLIDAFVFNADLINFPVTDDLRADVSHGLRSLAKELTSSEWTPLMPAMLEASERDDEFEKLIRVFMDSRRKPLKDRLAIAVKRGEIAKSPDIETVISLLVGPLFYRRLIARQPISRAFVDEVVESVIGNQLA